MFPKHYNPEKVEEKWQKYWQEKKVYKFNPESKKPIYSIDTPPPYASAAHLHVGHALHYTQFEIISRFRRMNGREVYFPPCFDDNGLPTEKYVEEKYNIKKGSISRPEFIELCREEARKIEESYADRFFMRLGHAYDWDLLYTTIGKRAQRVAQWSFLDLYEKGLIYRSKEPVLWCPYHQTALAQAEVEEKERVTKLSYLKFELEDGKEVEIATTRPELLPACVAVAVNPKDKRNKDLIGKKVRVPLSNRWVEIIGEPGVDPEFGTGVVMICTFGDTSDVEIWKTKNLDLRIIISEEGRMNEKAGTYEGLSIKEAKKEIIKDLKEEDLLLKQEDHGQTVGVCWRCDTPVEYLVKKQWFIKTLEFRDEIIEQAKKIKWYPEFMRKRLIDWTRNLKWDWCISRQRFYGVPIPVWYCKECGKPAFPNKKDLPVDPEKERPKKECECGCTEFEPEKDVFDTWMTSSMSPQISSRFLEDPELYERLYPMSLRPQSFDIIRTWAFYTILKSYLHFKSIPWEGVMIGTYVLDEKGRGMTKSRGNVIWLKDMIEKYPVDALRYWTSTAGIGENLPFKEKALKRGKYLLTKLWNASRFCSMHMSKTKGEKSVIDQWILTKLYETVKEATDYLINYQMSKARKSIEMFFKHDFCDNYIELAKYRLYKKDKAPKDTLYQCLYAIIRLFSPFIPHITEEIYQRLFREHEEKESVHLTEWPKPREVSKEAEMVGDLAVKTISSLRKYKTEHQMAMNQELSKVVIYTEKVKDKKSLEKVHTDIKETMRVKNLEIIKGAGKGVEIRPDIKVSIA